MDFTLNIDVGELGLQVKLLFLDITFCSFKSCGTLSIFFLSSYNEATLHKVPYDNIPSGWLSPHVLAF